MSKNINVPKLRFSEFSGEWEEKKLDNLTNKISDGIHTTPNYDDNGNFYFVNGNNLVDGIIKIDEKTKRVNESEYIKHKRDLNQNTILLSINGTIGNISFYNNENIVLGKSACYINVDDKLLDKYFIYNQFKTKSVLNFFYSEITGSTIKNLSLTTIKNTKIKLPSKLEQEKIASFLTSVDTRIEQLTKKETLLQEYKKGVMNKIFNQEIRFKDDDGREFPEWENSSLGNVLDYVQPTKYLVKDTEYNNSYNTPVLTAGKTFVLGYTNETDGIFGNNLPVIIFDDFTTANKFVDFPFKAKSSAMKILIPKNSNNIKFIYETMQMIKYEVGGHERHWISKFTFLNIFMPCIQEQTKIANFLSSIDKKIELTTKELNSTKEFKKALLQQMFV